MPTHLVIARTKDRQDSGTRSPGDLTKADKHAIYKECSPSGISYQPGLMAVMAFLDYLDIVVFLSYSFGAGVY